LKGHVGIDPDSEIITATTVTAGNTGDAAAAPDLLADDLPTLTPDTGAPAADDTAAAGTSAADATAMQHPTAKEETVPSPDGEDTAAEGVDTADSDDPLVVYGDAAYGAGDLITGLQEAGAENRCKVQPPSAAGGRFTKDAFDIDLPGRQVTCPAGNTAPLTRSEPGLTARFGAACRSCPLAARCTTAKSGRSVYVGPYEEQLTRARTEQRDPDWKADYRATRPKVERKIGHLMHRRHGGRRARVRGTVKIAADFSLLAAAVNLARLARLGLHHTSSGWAAATA